MLNALPAFVRRLIPFLAVLLAVAACAEIATRVYNRLPRLEDELANLFQARVFASGRLSVASPAEPEAFGVPFVIDLGGRRFSKYPPGESLALAVGVLFGDPWLIGPLLGGLSLAVIYRLARDLFDGRTARRAAVLGLTSPFFLMLTPSLMPHAATMLLLAVFALAFLRAWAGPPRSDDQPGVAPVPARSGDHKGRPYTRVGTGLAPARPGDHKGRPYARVGTGLAPARPGDHKGRPYARVGTGLAPARPGDHKGRPYMIWAGVALGFAFLVRPYAAVWVSLPVGALILAALRQGSARALAKYWPMAVSLALVAALLPLYNYALTGQARLSLYELWWPFDRLGFGEDVGPRGYRLPDALPKLGREVFALAYDLHGIPLASLLPMALGLLLPPRSHRDGLLALTVAALAVGTVFYHHSSRLYGPRYLYEALPAMLILGARGVVKLQARAARLGLTRLAYVAALGAWLAIDLGLFLPFRLALLHGLYDGALNSDVLEAAQGRAVVFIFADDWPEAAAGLMANDPDLRADVIYARYLGPDSYRRVVAAHPARAAYFWRAGQLTPASDPPPDWYPAYPDLRPPRDG